MTDWTRFRYSGLIVLVFSYFLVELAVGLYAGVIALQADAYHMFSDVLALIVGYLAYHYSHKSRDLSYTFGWIRAEVVGGLVNSVFLLAICLNIMIESILRLSEISAGKFPDFGENIDMVLIVIGIGLLINIVGFVLFIPRNNGHHGQGHHAGGGNNGSGGEDDLQSNDSVASASSTGSTLIEILNLGGDEQNGVQPARAYNLNQLGVFLHILGDLLGSAIALISSLLIKYLSSPYRYLADPIASLIIVSMLVWSSIQLFRVCLKILLHENPVSINSHELLEKIRALPGISEVHEFHVWPLNQQVNVASLHFRVEESLCETRLDPQLLISPPNTPVVPVDNHGEAALHPIGELIRQIKDIFHQYQIHSSTIQPEFGEDLCSEPNCHQDCITYKCCQADTARSTTSNA